MADKAEFIEHKGKRIFHINFRSVNLKEMTDIIAVAKAKISKEPAGSVLTLTDATGTDLTPDISQALKDFAAHNKPFVKTGAVLGVTGIKRVAYNALLVFTGRRNLHLFDDEDKAKDWLVSQ